MHPGVAQQADILLLTDNQRKGMCSSFAACKLVVLHKKPYLVANCESCELIALYL